MECQMKRPFKIQQSMYELKKKTFSLILDLHLSACLLVDVDCSALNGIKTKQGATSKWTSGALSHHFVSAFFRELLDLSQTPTASVPLQEAVHTQKQAFVYFQLSPFKSHLVKVRLVAMRRPFHHSAVAQMGHCLHLLNLGILVDV